MIKIFFLRWIGNFLLLSALMGVYLTFSPVISAEINYRYDQATNRRFVVADSSTVGKLSPANNKTGINLLAMNDRPLELTPLSTSFGIVIPKIAANARVIDNVNPGDSTAYMAALKEGVAHASGTAYPGEVGDTYLFAHSVGNFWEVNQWNAVFYLLRELRPGDEVDIFYKEKRYIYIVYDQKTVNPDETGYLEAQTNFPRLTLQTCWPPGTTLKRLLVFARLKGA